MAIYSGGVRTTLSSAAAPIVEIRTTATDRVKILEIGIFLVSATAAIFGIGRPAAIGTTITTSITMLAEDSGDPVGTGTLATAWTTRPTVPANFFRRVALPATIGAGVILTFPKGLIVAISNSVVIWNITTAPLADVYMVTDE